MRYGVVLVGAGIAIVAGMMVWTGPQSTAEAASDGCEQPVEKAPNVAVLDNSSGLWSDVVGTTEINGSIGWIELRSVTAEGNHTLVGPDGTEYGPRFPIDEELVFTEVELCDTGTWKILHNATGDVLSKFNVTTKLTEVQNEDHTFAVDQEVDATPAKVYEAGELYAHATLDSADARANWTGPLFPSGYSLTSPTVVAFSAVFDVDVDGCCSPAARVSVCTESEVDPTRRCRGLTFYGTDCYDCTITVATSWKAGNTYNSEIDADATSCAFCPLHPSDTDVEVRDVTPTE